MIRRFALITGYETAAVMLIIIILASLSVWGAFLIYRAVKGQQSKRGREDTKNETEKEASERGGQHEDDWNRATGSDHGGSEDLDVNSHETIVLSPAKHAQTPSELLEVNLKKTTHQNVNEPTAEPLIDSGVGDITETGRERMKGKHEVCDVAASICLQSDLFDSRDDCGRLSEDKPVKNVKNNRDSKESEISPHVDMDDVTETESAQEVLEAKILHVQKCQSLDELLDNTLFSQDIVDKPSEEIIVSTSALHISSDTRSNALHEKTNITDAEVAAKSIERSCFLMNDLGSHSHDEQSDLMSYLVSENVKSKDFSESNNNLQTAVGNNDDGLSNQQHLGSTFCHILASQSQNYLGFPVPGVQGNSLAPLQIIDDSKDKELVTKAHVGQRKNEISIMESIMDSNEWLSSGPPDTRDLQWLTKTPNKTGYRSKVNISSPFPATTGFERPAEQMMLHKDKIDMPKDTTTAVTKDEGDRLNKKIGTVLPMPQLVQVRFRVHYITHSPHQILAVTGNQQELGSWESFVPLRSVENGFWVSTISLPLESQVEWKFILVEEGKIRRWEECENRCFAVTGQEEVIHLYKNWGYA